MEGKCRTSLSVLCRKMYFDLMGLQKNSVFIKTEGLVQ